MVKINWNPHSSLRGNAKWYSMHNLKVSYKIKHMSLYDQAIIFTKKKNVHPNTCTQMFIATLFIITKKLEIAQISSAGK